MKAMSRRQEPKRRRVFGPLFYSTLVVALLALAFTAFLRALPALEERHELRAAVDQLRNPDAGIRESAAVRLARRGDEAGLARLIEAARDPSAEVRASACRGLVAGQANPRVVVPVLVVAAKDTRDEVRLEAARGFGRVVDLATYFALPTAGAPGGLSPELRTECVDALRRLLGDRAYEVRAAAADALANYGPDPGLAGDLANATGDGERDVRFASAKALLKVNGPGDATAVKALVALAAEPDLVPDRRAVMEVVRAAGPEAQALAAEALARLVAPGTDPVVLHDVIGCLSLAGPGARATLPALEGLMKGKDPDLRYAAGMALAEIELFTSRRGAAVLITIVNDSEQPIEGRTAALETLRMVGPSALAKATPGLIRQLGDPKVDVRFAAAQLLSAIIGDTPAQMPGPDSEE
jgi:HEAT repeat protein